MTITAYRRRLRAHYRLTYFEALLGVSASLTLRRAMLLPPAER
jgi:hypothetical protein